MTLMPYILRCPLALRTGVHHFFGTVRITLVSAPECQNNKINSTRTINVGSSSIKDKLPLSEIAETVPFEGTCTLALKTYRVSQLLHDLCKAGS